MNLIFLLPLLQKEDENIPERKNVKKTAKGATIKAKLKGVKESSLPLKAVIYVEEKAGIRVLSEAKIYEDEFKIDLEVDADNIPETAKIAVVPAEIENVSHVKRIAESDMSPVVTLKKAKQLARKGILPTVDLPMKSLGDIVNIWKLKHKVCGRVFKKDPITGEKCPVPGATVRVFDVDMNLLWWHPYPDLPWEWFYPHKLYRKEEIATTTTDEHGYFCTEIPYFDIDAVLRWRLRFRCLWEILKPPTILDALDLGLKPDIRYYPEFKILPEMAVKPRPRPIPDPAPVIDNIELRKPLEEIESKLLEKSVEGYVNTKSTLIMKELFSKPQFEKVRQNLFEKKGLFDSMGAKEMSVLAQPAFPHSIAAPQLPDDERLMEIMNDMGAVEKEDINEIHVVKPLVRLLRCWPEAIPEWKLFLDIPDIIFKVEQDIDADGNLETIYDEGFFDVNWNLNEPTTNVLIEAWSNAICVPCGTEYKPCTRTGIAGINDMPLDPVYQDAMGYATRVNRPLGPSSANRPAAETPFCSTLRIVGCPDYGNAALYKVFYRYGGIETHFTESWHVYNIGNGTIHHVMPDANGFYPVLTSPDNYFPYHTLINWVSHRYPDGKYELRLALYDAARNPIGPILPPVKVVIDNSKPAPINFLKLEYRELIKKKGDKEEDTENVWGDYKEVPLLCPVIKRTPGTDIELKVKYNVAATHLRDIDISFSGCGGNIGSNNYWHQKVSDKNVILDWTIGFPGTKPEGGYQFYLKGFSRAFNAIGGLNSDWHFDPLHIWDSNTLNVVILNNKAP